VDHMHLAFRECSDLASESGSGRTSRGRRRAVLTRPCPLMVWDFAWPLSAALRLEQQKRGPFPVSMRFPNCCCSQVRLREGRASCSAE